MLVLHQKVNQEILIQVPINGMSGTKRTIVVKVLWVGERRVNLGFAADDDIKILRKELVEE